VTKSDVTRIVLNVAVVIFSLQDDRLQVLLSPSRDRKWELPSAELGEDEPLEEAAGRAFAGQIDKRMAHLEQLYTYGEPHRDPRGRLVSIVYFGLVPSNAQISPGNMLWHRMDSLPALEYDHRQIISYAVHRLRYKLEYSAVGFQLLPEKFTLSQLQHTYEIILGEPIDKRNFRRRILKAGIIEATPQRRTGEGRPARLYRYRLDAVAEVKARRLFP
jgi:8-oxo-dGTP diphosphatase